MVLQRKELSRIWMIFQRLLELMQPSFKAPCGSPDKTPPAMHGPKIGGQGDGGEAVKLRSYS